MSKDNGGLDDKQANNGGSAAPRWSIFLVVALVAHLGEEWWGGSGFSAWAQATLGVELAPSRQRWQETRTLAARVVHTVCSPDTRWLVTVTAEASIDASGPWASLGVEKCENNHLFCLPYCFLF